jgi:hypothetical protein
MIRLVQLSHPGYGRWVAVVQGDYLHRLNAYRSVYDLAMAAIVRRVSVDLLAAEDHGAERMAYQPVYEGNADWRLLPAFDHPEEPARCLVAGTGLTHLASAANRQAMHAQTGHVELTDSMRMFQWGMEGGKPAPDRIGVPPEWFYKGHGTILRGHGAPLVVAADAGDGGEEPEIAGVYVVGPDGQPYRVGLVMANEFSDHVTEKKNYLYLAPSKLRTCAIGPELVAGGPFEDVRGTVAIERSGAVLWSQPIKTGEANMCHSLANLEHHHFKYEAHRRPGDAHVYFYGADAFSFGAGISLQEGDVMVVSWEGFGRPLRNPVAIDRTPESLVKVGVL